MTRNSGPYTTRRLVILSLFLMTSVVSGCGEKVEQIAAEKGKSVEESTVKGHGGSDAKKHDAAPRARVKVGAG